MRLWHLILAVAGLAVVLTLARDPMTRVLLVVFATGLGEVAFGLASTCALIQTVGALGHAKGAIDHAEATLATALVLAVGTALMSGWLFVGCWLVSVSV